MAKRHPLKPNKEKLAIIVLTLTALGLGLMLVKQYSLDRFLKLPQKPESSQNYQTPTQSVAPVQAASVLDIKFPEASASEKLRQDFANNIISQAKATETISIKNCLADPPVSQLKLDQKFTVQNNDGTEVLINITPEDQYTVKPNSSMILTARFSHGEGIYGFKCNKQSDLSGIIFITTQP